MQDLLRFGIQAEDHSPQAGAIYSLICLYSLVERSIVNYLRPYNLSGSQFNALMIIKHIGKDKGISQIEIGEKLIVSASNMTRLLDKLNKEKLVERLPQEHDRRVNLIKITNKGSKLLDEIWPGYEAILKELGKSLETKELEQLTALSLKWFNKLNYDN